MRFPTWQHARVIVAGINVQGADAPQCGIRVSNFCKTKARHEPGGYKFLECRFGVSQLSIINAIFFRTLVSMRRNPPEDARLSRSHARVRPTAQD